MLLELTKQAAQEEVVLSLNVSQLGAEGKMRTFDLTVTSYLRKISLDYCEIKGNRTHTRIVWPRFCCLKYIMLFQGCRSCVVCVSDAQNQPLHLITSSDKHGSDLLKVEYIKVNMSILLIKHSIKDSLKGVVLAEWFNLCWSAWLFLCPSGWC